MIAKLKRCIRIRD